MISTDFSYQVRKIYKCVNSLNFMEKKEILLKTSIEYYLSGLDELDKNRYNSAVILFFKSLVAITDLYIYEKTGDTPSSHSKRFRIAEDKFPDIYFLLDKNFPFYQDSYIQIMSYELAEVIRKDVQTVAKKLGIEI